MREVPEKKKLKNCRLHLGEDDPVGCDDDVILRHLSLCDLPLLVPVIHQHAQPTRLHLRSIVYKLRENSDVDLDPTQYGLFYQNFSDGYVSHVQAESKTRGHNGRL